jgi:hypothetical protein
MLLYVWIQISIFKGENKLEKCKPLFCMNIFLWNRFDVYNMFMLITKKNKNKQKTMVDIHLIFI